MLHGASHNLTQAQKEYEAGQLLPRCVNTSLQLMLLVQWLQTDSAWHCWLFEQCSQQFSCLRGSGSCALQCFGICLQPLLGKYVVKLLAVCY
jgi:hypothetical protein